MVGARATGSASRKFGPVTLTARGEVGVGVGARGHAKIELCADGKCKIDIGLSGFAGVGAGASLSAEVDVEAAAEAAKRAAKASEQAAAHALFQAPTRDDLVSLNAGNPTPYMRQVAVCFFVFLVVWLLVLFACSFLLFVCCINLGV
jgi:hypothetical protein